MVTRLLCGYDVMVACQLPKLNARVRFPLPAPVRVNVQALIRHASVHMGGMLGAPGRTSKSLELQLVVVVPVADV